MKILVADDIFMKMSFPYVSYLCVCIEVKDIHISAFYLKFYLFIYLGPLFGPGKALFPSLE